MNLKKKTIFHVLFSVAFFISGFCINVIQCILFNTLAWIDMKLYRRINYYLTYSLWSQIVALSQWWADTELNIYFADENSEKRFAKTHMLCLMNHTFEIDWVISWITIDHFNNLGYAKSFVKKSLRWIPIIGWSWIFGEFVFLERNLEKDSDNIVNALKKFLEFESPISLLVFAEGTRFTSEKHETSKKFANERGLPILKHHLLPRPRGFNLCVKTFKQEIFSEQEVMIAQLQLRFPKDQPRPTFMTLLRGEKVRADLYARVIPLKEVPNNTEKDTTDYLYYLYKEQDELVDYYDQHGCFPGIKTKIYRRKAPLLNIIGWMVFNTLLVKYFLSHFIVNSSWTVIIITFSFIFIALFSVHIMINSTKIKKASSYGIDQSRKEK